MRSCVGAESGGRVRRAAAVRRCRNRVARRGKEPQRTVAVAEAFALFYVVLRYGLRHGSTRAPSALVGNEWGVERGGYSVPRSLACWYRDRCVCVVYDEHILSCRQQYQVLLCTGMTYFYGIPYDHIQKKNCTFLGGSGDE